MNDMNEDIGETILIPVAFIVGGFILTFLLPFIHSNRRRRNRLDGLTNNENLSDREIDDSVTVKYVLPHSIAHSILSEDINRYKGRKWWNSEKSSDISDLRKLREYSSASDCDNENNNNDTINTDTVRSDDSSHSSDSALICHICMEAFHIAERIALPKHQTCDHIFHYKCIKLWLKCKNTCPCCRDTYITAEQKLDEEAHSCFHFNSCCFKKKSDGVDRCLTSTHFCQIHGLIHNEKVINHDEEDDIKTTSIRSAIDLSV